MLLILLSAIQSVAIFKNGYYDMTDSGLANVFFQQHPQTTLWNQVYYGGAQNSIIETPLGYLFNEASKLIYIAMGPILGAEFFYFLIFSFTAITAFLLLKWVAWPIAEGKKNLIAMAGSVFYTFFFYPQYGPSHNLLAAFLPACALLLIMLSESCRRRNSLFIMVFGLAAALLISVMTSLGGDAYIMPNIIILGLISITLILSSERKKEMALAFAAVMALLITLNLNIIIPSYLNLSMLGNQISNNSPIGSLNSLSILVYYNQQNIFTALQVYGNPNTGEPIFQYAANNLAAITAQVFIAITIFIAVTASWLDSTKRKAVIIASAMSMILLIFLFDNVSPLLGPLFKYLVLNSSVFLLLTRASQPIFYYAITFIEAILFVYAISFIAQSKKYGNFLLAIAILTVIIHFYFFNVIELQNATSFQIPSYAFQTANYINSQNLSGQDVAILPAQFPFGYYTTYYYGTNIYVYLINGSVWTGGYVSAYDILLPSRQMIGYGMWAETIGNTIIVNKSAIGSRMAAYGIKYIIVEDDAVQERNYTNFTIQKIYANLNDSQNIQKVAQFNQSSIYEVTDPKQSLPIQRPIQSTIFLSWFISGLATMFSLIALAVSLRFAI